jgi:hypothetical protein
MLQTVAIPPVNAVMPHAQVGLIEAWGAFAACSVIFCCILSIRSRSLLPVSIMLGSGLAMFAESVVIPNMHTWYPAIGQITAYKAYGQSIPLFAALAYWFYFAPAILLFMGQYERGITRLRFWTNCVLTMLGVVGYEIAGLSLHLWSYYGVKPLDIGGLPIANVFLNASTVIPASVILFRLRAQLHGWRMLLVVAFMAADVPGFEFLTGYPVFFCDQL